MIDLGSLLCSSACELAAQRMAAQLGTLDAAMNQFVAAQPVSTVQPVERKYADTAASTYAAGAEDTPIMLNRVKVSRHHLLAPLFKPELRLKVFL